MPRAHHGQAARVISLTNADNGRVIAAASGDTVAVGLTAVTENGVKRVFTKPVSSDPTVAVQTGGTEKPDGGATGSFELVRSGAVVVQADRRCVVTRPGAVCPQVITPWKATVNVA
ncbi:hypothetical protein ACFQVC_28500 [Streptomyces monticola]|uniref:Uncharacterized protein n=1 Tax=Streptomyces monticola TaxID=2666263 RepID=A0ABW2JRX3_9ACTN